MGFILLLMGSAAFLTAMLLKKLLYMETYSEQYMKRYKMIVRIMTGICIVFVALGVLEYILFYFMQKNPGMHKLVIGVSNISLFIGIVFVALALIVVISSSISVRKQYKWLGVFDCIPLGGYFNMILNLANIPSFLFPELMKTTKGIYYSDFIIYIGYVPVILIDLFIILKKPKWYRNYLKDIEELSFSFKEAFVVRGMGIWLILMDVVFAKKLKELGIAVYIYYLLSTAVIIVTIIILVLDINRKKHYYNKNSRLQKSLIIAMADLVENRDENTGGHIQRTAKYVEIIANQLRDTGIYTDILTDKYIEHMVIAAPLHDVGKIRIPDAVLNKPGRLTDEEFAQMKTHSSAGRTIIDQVEEETGDIEYLTIAKEMAEFHHERMDGKGYPHGLVGEEIPLCAKILAVADVFDALVSKRCYKDAMPLDKAFSIIEEETGDHFDVEVAKAFLESRERIEQCLEEFQLHA